MRRHGTGCRVADPFDGRSILRVLTDHGVAFILVGGFAATLHGSPLLTRDVDIVPERTTDNLARLSAALTELEARIRVDAEPAGFPFDHDAASLAGVTVLNLRTRYGDLDLTFTPSGTTGYPDLRRDAIELTLAGTHVLVASLADVIRSKAAANRDKDRRALPVLRELLARQRTPRRGG
jgi:predicted nucleotidyltransferase